MVVFTATIPSSPSSAASSATASTSSSDRSGAIFTSSGTAARPAAAVASSAATRVASRIGRSASTDCRSRRPGVFGRGDVDHEVVGVGREPARARGVVGGRAARPGVTFVLPMFTPTTSRRPAGVARSRRSRAATAAEPSLLKPIRLRSARWSSTRHSRGGSLPGWPLRGHGADLDEAEPEHRQARDPDGVLVEARRERRTATGSAAPHTSHGARRRTSRTRRRRRPAQHRDLRRRRGSARTRPRGRARGPCGGRRGRTAGGTR